MRAVLLALFLCCLSIPANAGGFDARSVFGTVPSRDLDVALKRAQKDNKRVFLVLWNSREKGNYPGLEIRYFAELKETKKLLEENFIIVLLDRDDPDVRPYLPTGNIEKAQWVLVAADGRMIKQDAVYGNPDVGLQTVKELIALP